MNVSTILFDAYGTLFDLQSALEPAAARLGDRAQIVFDRWRTLQLDYAWLSALRNERLPFEVCTRRAYADALAAAGVEDDGLVDMLSEGFRSVRAYADASGCLEALREAGHQTAILTNGDLEMVTAASEAAGLAPLLDEVISVEPSGTYKPAPDAYAVGLAFSKRAARDTLFVSSNWWDVAGAASFGYRVAHVARPGSFWPRSEDAPKIVVDSLVDLLPEV